MRPVILPLGAILAACGGDGSAESSSWLGDACGVPDLAFTVNEKRRQLRLKEYQVQGTQRTAAGITGATVTERQRLIERALPCLRREAGRRGLALEYPVVNVDG